MTMIENKTNRIEFVRVNPNSGGPWDVWRIDYDEMEAGYYQIVSQNGDVIPYDGWIGHYLENKGFKVTEIDGVSYRFIKSREK